MKKIVALMFVAFAMAACGPAGPNTPGECKDEGGEWTCVDGPGQSVRCWCDL
jgi:hypothetical protein